jgi:nitroimidazol reductase NimA-like FMN-containing flavoprotein (pyridoxamine 5'-phosphate oxidase superfamily)
MPQMLLQFGRANTAAATPRRSAAEVIADGRSRPDGSLGPDRRPARPGYMETTDALLMTNKEREAVSGHDKAIMETLGEAECLRLVSAKVIGRLAFVGGFEMTVQPVNYRLVDGAILFRTARDSLTGEDLRTGIRHAEYKVAFEVDEFDEKAREGWSVLIQGPAHHLDSSAEQEAALAAGVEPWPGGEKDHFIKITPTRITGRRVRQAPGTDEEAQ